MWKAKMISQMMSILLLFSFFSCAGLLDGKPDFPPPENTESSGKEYLIGRGDLLEIVTWKEPDLSREVKVRSDGKITFPLLDDIQAAGRTPMEIKEEIQEKLAAYVKVPSVTVTVKETGSQKFYILGEVENTGEYLLDKNLTLLQAVALAGGFTEWAMKKEIILIRKQANENQIITLNYEEIIEGENPEQNIPLKANDTIIVP